MPKQLINNHDKVSSSNKNKLGIILTTPIMIIRKIKVMITNRRKITYLSGLTGVYPLMPT